MRLNKSGIAWCDWVWSVHRGCTPASTECDHCYAKLLTNRFKRFSWEPHTCIEDLARPLSPKTARGVVFVDPLSDFFHESFDDTMRHVAVTEMADQRNLTFVILTKRPQNITDRVSRVILQAGNVWTGVSIGTQARVDSWLTLHDNIRSKRFVSMEPLLEEVSFLHWPAPEWAIVGCESGASRRKISTKTILNTVRGLPRRTSVFVKQMEVEGRVCHDPEMFPRELQRRERPF